MEVNGTQKQITVHLEVPRKNTPNGLMQTMLTVTANDGAPELAGVYFLYQYLHDV